MSAVNIPAGQEPANGTERSRTALESILLDYLSTFMPAPSVDTPGAIVKTSNDIIFDLEQVVDLDKNQVANVMLNLGFRTTKRKSGLFGWLMMPMPDQNHPL